MPTMVWSIKGSHFANCNCDYGCPCQLTPFQPMAHAARL